MLNWNNLLRSLCCLLSVSLFMGCGGGTDGPQRYPLSGSVTFDGEPVPKGFLTLSPDTEKGNKGPQGGVEIIDGKYEVPEEKGHVGGDYIVQIVGFDGVPYEEEGETVKDGKELFPTFETKVSFPKESSEKDFTIPTASSE